MGNSSADMLSVRAVVFDAFGTLVDIGMPLSPYRQLMRWMRNHGRRPHADDAAVIMSNPIGLAETAAMFGMSPSAEMLAEWNDALAAELRSVQLFSDAVPAIERLQQAGYQIGLCSNLAQPYGNPVKTLLPALDAYAMSYDAGAVKPDSMIYRFLLDQLGCSAAEVLFVGDTPSTDFHAPIAYGMAARLIDRTSGQGLHDLLRDLA